MKKFLFSLIAVFAALSLVACGGNSNTEKSTKILSVDEIDTSKNVEVRFYHAMGAANQAVIQTIADNFSADMKKQYGVNVTVVQQSQGDYTTLRDTISAEIASGDQPTIAQTYPDHVALYLEGNAVRGLDDYISHSEYGLEGSKANNYGFIENFWKEGSVYDQAGTMYSIPFNKSTEVLFYNKDLFDKYSWEVPETWDDVVEIAKAWLQTTEYKAKTEGASAVKGAGLGIDSEDNFFITLIRQWGSPYTGFDKNGVGQFLFNNADAIAGLKWLVEQFNNKYIVSATYFGTNYCSDAFKNGQCPMTLGSSAGASYNVVSDGSFVTGVAPYPQKAGAKENEKFVIQQGTNVTLFNCADKQEELFGWLFIKYLTNYESSLYWTLNTAYFPIREDVVASAEYQDYLNMIVRDEQGNGKVVYNAVQYVCSVGFGQSKYFYTSEAFPGSSAAREEGETIIQEILYNQTEYTVEKALQDAINKLELNR